MINGNQKKNSCRWVAGPTNKEKETSQKNCGNEKLAQ